MSVVASPNDPSRFGNLTHTTCLVGGSAGIVNCTGNAIFDGDVTANYLFGMLNWSYLYGYPVACPANTYLTQLDDSVTCTAISDVYLFNTGDTASGTYNFDSNTLVVDSTTHRVGIGTASPAYNLHVWNAGGTGVKTTVSVKQEDDGAGHAGALAQLESSGWNEAYVRLGGHYIGATAGDMKYYVASGDHYFANGKVGIGTPAPDNILEVHSTAATKGIDISSTANNPVLNLRIDNDGASYTAGIYFSGWNASSVDTNLARISSYQTANAASGDLRFYTADGGVFTEAIRIDKDGNVGIGTASPDYQFQVEKSSATDYVLADFRNTNTGAGAYANIYLGNNAATPYLQFRTSRSTGHAQIGNPGNQELNFFTNGVANTRMTIKEDGKVGIGTTAPLATLAIGGAGSTSDGLYVIKSTGGTDSAITAVGGEYGINAHGTIYDGRFLNSGIRAANYYSGDGTQGLTTTFNFVESLCYNATGSLFSQSKTVTVKDGLITSIGHLGSPSGPGVCPV